MQCGACRNGSRCAGVSYFIIIILVVLVDQVSKFWVMTSLPLYGSIVVIPHFFNLTYVTNKGAAFSFLAQADGIWRHYFFLTIGSLAVVALTVVWFRTRRQEPIQGVGLALIAGGACGNMIDRFFRGEVIDFLDLFLGSYHWPVFNIADSAICVGVVIILACSFFVKKNSR